TQELCIARSIDDTHAALTKLRRNFIRANTRTWCDCHIARDYNELDVLEHDVLRVCNSLSCPVAPWKDLGLVHELAFCATRPWIVRERKANSVGNRWMRVEEENVYRVRLRISQIHITQNLKCLGSDLP